MLGGIILVIVGLFLLIIPFIGVPVIILGIVVMFRSGAKKNLEVQLGAQEELQQKFLDQQRELHEAQQNNQKLSAKQEQPRDE